MILSPKFLLRISFFVRLQRRLTVVGNLLFCLWAFALLLAEYGLLRYGEQASQERFDFYRRLDTAFVVALAVYLLITLLRRGSTDYIRQRWVETFLVPLAVIMLIATAGRGDAFAYFTLVLKLVIGIVYAARLLLRLIPLLNLTTPLLIAFSFLFIISTGFLLLMLPAASVSGSIRPTDALFTATSATCVTGLVVVDTGTYFSPFGQIIVLALIQIGGLGLMTFVAFFSLTVGTGLGIKTETMVWESLNLRVHSSLSSVLAFILLSTFVMELLGFVGIFLSFPFEADWSLGYRLYFSLFHSISAFCNSGFSLLSDSITRARSSVPINLIFIALIMVGGFGFAVNMRIFQKLYSIFRRKKRTENTLPQFRMQTRIVLFASLILVLLGAGIIYFSELNNSFADYSQGEKVLASVFQSVSARTAGFNTVEIGKLSIPVLLLIIALMFIGASPGGTGGGVKTTTFTLFILAITSRLRNREYVEVYGRTIPWQLIHNALIILFFATVLVFIFSALVAAFGFDEAKLKEAPEIAATLKENGYIRILFEVVSAFGTVGYSTGITKFLSTGSKLVLVLAMFIGRIGPFTLLLAMSRQAKKMKYSYPTEGIMVG